jgi:hypothetical protein
MTSHFPIRGNDPKEFFVWIDPNDFLVQNNIGMVGGIAQPEPNPEDTAPEHLKFIHNPNHRQGFISRFHLNVMYNYGIEYDLERFRYENFKSFPSCLHAMYLFENKIEASRYYAKHPSHVGSRVLKRGVTAGPYLYSIHDSAWIDFLRLQHSMDADTFNFCWRGYWSGDRASNHTFQSMGKPWVAESIMEVLFYGRLNFSNKDVSVFD